MAVPGRSLSRLVMTERVDVRRNMYEGERASVHFLGRAPSGVHSCHCEIDPRRNVLVHPVGDTRRVRALTETSYSEKPLLTPNNSDRSVSCLQRESNNHRIREGA